jgi:hypothetical protein
MITTTVTAPTAIIRVRRRCCSAAATRAFREERPGFARGVFDAPRSVVPFDIVFRPYQRAAETGMALVSVDRRAPRGKGDSCHHSTRGNVTILRVLAHRSLPGPAPFVATGLFLVAMVAGYGAWRLFTDQPDSARLATAIGLAVVASACAVAGTTLPLFLGARPSFARPSTSARLSILTPRPGEVIRGDPASIDVQLQLEAGKVVPLSSFRLVPNEGHIHLYLDGALVSMTSGLAARITADPGSHELRAEFVAVDHAPFQPRVIATVTFSVRR